MTLNEFNENMNALKNVIFIGCIICAYVFAFIQPIKSIAFTLLATLVGLTDMKMKDK